MVRASPLRSIAFLNQLTCLVLLITTAVVVPGSRARGDERPASALNILRDARTPIRRSGFQSWQGDRHRHVVIQAQDYSCGAAALATLFQYYFEDNVTEGDVLERIVDALSDEELEDRMEHGLSMTDLLNAAKDLGYLGAAVRLEMKKIPELQAPVIVRIEKNDYKHFVVLRGSVEDRIYLADPIRGNIRMSAVEFMKQWSGEAVVLGKRGFGLPHDYPLAIQEQPPVRNELDTFRRSLHQRRLSLPR